MANFNTYQTRQFYVAKAVAENDLANPGDIKLGQTATGDIFFKYMNADGIATRSDTIIVKNIHSLKKTVAAAMDTPLMKHTIKLKSTIALAGLVGKTLNAVITIHGVASYDASDSLSFVAPVEVTDSMTAVAFHKALAEAIALALPKRQYPFLKVMSNGTEVTKAIAKAGTATGSANGVVLVQTAQKWRRGLMSNEPFDFSVAFSLQGSNSDFIVWGEDTVEKSNEVIPSAYVLADLEYFALGERGDYYRGNNWPNNYEPTYFINPADTTTTYDVLSIEYFWQGGAENVQKSPRMIQVAGPAAVITALNSAIEAIVNPVQEEGGEG